MRESIDGLILAHTTLKESDKFLCVLCPKYGRISLYANHARSFRKGAFPYTTPMQYCRFSVDKRGDNYRLASGEVLHSFLDLSEDLCSFALAQYVLDVTRVLTVENTDESEMLSLALNTLYVIQKGAKALELIKSTFEFRAMAIAGYMPDLSGCSYCDKNESRVMYFDIMNGALICSDCQRIHDKSADTDADHTTAVIVERLTSSMLAGLRYVLSAPANRVFSYSIAPDEQGNYSRVCEKYILNHLERGFATLDFYKQTVAMPE